MVAGLASTRTYPLRSSFRPSYNMAVNLSRQLSRSQARALLERGCRPAEAAALTGFADQAHLTRWFRRVVGVTPGLYRNSVQDRTPRYR